MGFVFFWFVWRGFREGGDVIREGFRVRIVFFFLIMKEKVGVFEGVLLKIFCRYFVIFKVWEFLFFRFLRLSF